MKESKELKQLNLRVDTDTYDRVFEVAGQQAAPVSLVVRKLICMWATDESLQKEIRLTDVQSLSVLEE